MIHYKRSKPVTSIYLSNIYLIGNLRQRWIKFWEFLPRNKAGDDTVYKQRVR